MFLSHLNFLKTLFSVFQSIVYLDITCYFFTGKIIDELSIYHITWCLSDMITLSFYVKADSCIINETVQLLSCTFANCEGERYHCVFQSEGSITNFVSILRLKFLFIIRKLNINFLSCYLPGDFQHIQGVA